MDKINTLQRSILNRLDLSSTSGKTLPQAAPVQSDSSREDPQPVLVPAHDGEFKIQPIEVPQAGDGDVVEPIEEEEPILAPVPKKPNGLKRFWNRYVHQSKITLN
ncbi:hypothetical protein BABINDRAFT_164579 [Babjeviella inositovora NRRL Y-12698]|uniref:Uncharacterized protein n=1 Tax=Babjeviella inositovora NRRL Y-12698 TaxID=984486 RepID=A0A1E3QYY3_9ASCO|nr:uncharacterized protein BABINDRAFT_164579 [Babjeviella inositovora NRRL Y-12698]ODQ82846.1 hypothetical protein BABINDRAFT_164579 [Babjeviella inositovora NRRL Y-12698]